jgi:hypothetical protein
MNSKPVNTDSPKPANAIDRSDVSSKPISAAKWKARNAVLVTPKDARPQRPTNGGAPPVKPRSHKRKPAGADPEKKARRDP